ncbi:MAG: VanZ family protein [Candidatus Hodarchaeota archaeon]
MDIIYPILYMVLIFLYSSIHDTQNIINISLSFRPGINNIIHIPAYGFLTFLWFLRFKKKKVKNKSLFYAATIAFVFGIFMELNQIFIPGRFASPLDILLNSLGIILSVFLISILLKISIIKTY